MQILALVLCALAVSTSASKIAIFTPQHSSSQVIYNKRVAEELAKAGHDVTLILLKNVMATHSPVHVHPNVTVWNIDAAAQSTRNMNTKLRDRTFTDIPIWDLRTLTSYRRFSDVFVSSCEKIVQNNEFLKRLTDARFDVAFAHMYDFCPIGLIHYAKIPTWIWLNSGVLNDLVAHDVGVHSPSSYVPAMMVDASDAMSFGERLKSQVARFLFTQLYPWSVADPETELFRKHIDPQFPDLRELGKQCPLVMVNSNELYDLPRPILHKVVYIGGIGMKKVDAKPLEAEFKELVETAEKVVLMSFGSVAHAPDMPNSWKKAFMGAFAKFPDVKFIVRYAADDLKDVASKNVHFSEWIPQSDLLQHPKTAAFITHGGYNSLQEAIIAGKPLITIPLFGDQPRNARIAQKHGIGYLITKAEVTEENLVKALKAVLTEEKYSVAAKHGIGYLITKAEVTEENLVKALKAVLTEEKYSMAAVRLRYMLEKKPIAPETLLTRWTEFLVEFKTLDNLVPHGTKLGFVQYHNIDVMIAIVSVLGALLFILFKFLQMSYRCVLFVVRNGRKLKEN
uniref:glucuronosyltransferase n=1 Tax=Steinernema glaseri TaxID=37863 RepID=A0A1I7YQ59_9BILA